MSTRIISGTYRSRALDAPAGLDIRPTSARTRASGFDMLGSRLHWPDVHALDLCCGIGSLGLEALSRGAAHCTFVDTRTAPCQHNLLKLGIPASAHTLHTADATRFTPPDAARINLVLADPPYGQHLLPLLLTRAPGLCAPGSLWLLESETDATLNPPAGFELLKERRHGRAMLWLLHWQGG